MNNATTTTICHTTYRTMDGATIGVRAHRIGDRVAVSVYWPAGMDTAPSRKWFDNDADAIAGYVTACQQIKDKYAA